MKRKTFGKQPSGNRQKRIEQSKNYRDGTFHNIEHTPVLAKDVSYFKILKDYFNKPKSVTPPKTLPSVKTDLHGRVALKPTITWFGHSSYLLRSGSFNLLVDPVFSGHASPFSSMVKAFSGSDMYEASDMPMTDLLVITHDHYDHLDYETIIKLNHTIKKIVAPLGVGEHLEYWGVESDKITELDWWESIQVENEIQLTATPARHFSGRGFTRGKTLWTSYVLNIHGYNIFLGGDSGYDKQFEEIGKKYGPFDLAILEDGQYGDGWPYIHMKPEETVQAAMDLGAKVLLPVHWGKFALANHPWNEPIERVLVAANKVQLPTITLEPGASYTIGEAINKNYWWRE